MRFKYEELEEAPLIVNAIYEGGTKGNPAADDPLTKLFRLDGYIKSVGNRGGFRKSRKESGGKVKDQLAYTVIFSTGKVDEWPDLLNEKKGTFTYYGDNKTPNNNHLDTKQRGNVLLKDVFEKAYKSKDERREIPPMFIFESTVDRLH
ncbi:hypothetical protein N781_15835 [Pontibacillus halophilus JSM 076056 = DSM 19796]|uniref:Restriction endonuclease AspBHI N-terminal domain-containing protein n=1 Tax=Pontibacillus halophilus JSM 076056 = DSM 19796 TaxID=1385510 RepID=A0A0A5GHS6_9BACI|nr:hypothetical protein [Pontibacillus halophilus]KGX92816.1 hypothetical protein N781_15835 [Pontibacillus halophilus JSM 076056 = DSM 19796]